jgi:hypothetical protein
MFESDNHSSDRLAIGFGLLWLVFLIGCKIYGW